MNYSYDGAETKEIIQNYKTSNNKIIITFLDGTNYETPLTEENEINLLNKMLEQAEERSQKMSIYDLKKERTGTFNFIMTYLGITVLSISNASTTNSKDIRCLTSLVGGITALNVILDMVKYKQKNDKIKELKKYDIYLQIREILKDINDPNLFNGVKKQEEPLNINTLDSYSLSDIKKIRNNLKRNEKYFSYFDKDGNNPTLTKRIGK